MLRSSITAGTVALIALVGWLVVPVGKVDAHATAIAADAGPLVVTDSRGREHRFDALPTRFAACSSFALETLMALGVEPVVRFESDPVYPAEAASIPIVGRTHSTGPDVEMLIATQPDVILLHDVFAEFADNVQQQVGVPVVLHDIDSVADVREFVAMFGALTGKVRAAEALLGRLDATVAWIQDQPAPDQPVRALSLLGTNNAWFAHRGNSFMGDVMATMGLENIAADADAHGTYRSLAPVDLEQIIAQDPDVIFIVPYAAADPAMIEAFRANPAFASLRAAREDRVFLLDNPMYQANAGPRSDQALRELYGLLFPDREQPPAELARTESAR
ncbi:MAG: ABC transporter substrate-binding protein [Planctomycetota bacterium]